MTHLKILKLFAATACLALTTQLSGCATGTSALECAAESMNPTVMASIDSFESAALAIKLSNHILLEMPISEQDMWPANLHGAPSGAAVFKMGLSMLGSSQGVTVPLEMDPKTGLPRPTSALYIFLKERERMLENEASKEDINFFKRQPTNAIARVIPANRRKADIQLIDEHVYRNPLMAFGVVTANRLEMMKVQQDVDLLAKGFRQCDAWVHKSSAGEVKPAACQDPALKQDNLEARIKKTSFTPANGSSTPSPEPAPPVEEKTEAPEPQPVAQPRDLKEDRSTKASAAARNRNTRGPKANTRNSRTRTSPAPVEQKAEVAPVTARRTNVATQPAVSRGIIYVSERDRLTSEKTEELETMRQNYGKLAGRVYNASVAGADFSMASIVKIGCAIVNGVRALPNINNEFRGARGVYNIVMIRSRVGMIIDSFGYYKDNLGLQYTAYSAMYQQLNGTYPDMKHDDPEEEKKIKQALMRVELAQAVLKDIEPKLEQFAKGKDVEFTDSDVNRMNALAKLYPDDKTLEKNLLAAFSAAGFKY